MINPPLVLIRGLRRLRIWVSGVILELVGYSYTRQQTLQTGFGRVESMAP
jgi:hypothetical protein